MASPYQQNQQQQQSNRRPSRNPLESDFADSSEPVIEVLPASALEAQERAQVDIQVATANRYKRGTLLAIRERIEEMATMDEETAAGCFYTLSRKDKNSDDEKIIQDATIRLAEFAVVCYKNLRIGTQIIGNDGLQITVRGACMDIENNIAVSMDVTRPIASKSGNGYRTWGLDMINVTTQAASAIAYRNAAFKIIPKALIKPVLEKCKKIAAGEGPIQQRWQKAVAKFRPWGVTDAMLRAYLEKPLDKPVEEVMDDKCIVDLIGLFNGFRDGEELVQDVFGNINKDGSSKTPPPPDPTGRAFAPTREGQADQSKQAEQPQQTKPVDTPQSSAAEQRPATPQEQKPTKADESRSGKTRTASSQATPSTGSGLFSADAPDDSPKGPFRQFDFSDDEYVKMLNAFSRAGKGQRTHLNAYLADWNGTKNELFAEMEKLRRD